MRKVRFDVAQFLREYHAVHAQGGTIHDLAASLGLDWKVVSNRRYRLSQKGIPMPRLRGEPRGRSRVVARLEHKVHLIQPVEVKVAPPAMCFIIDVGCGHG